MKADKNNAAVILDRTEYEREIICLLDDDTGKTQETQHLV